MPALATVRVVAGEKGLTNRIQWVNVTEISELVDRPQEGELLCTHASGLKAQPDLQAAFIPSLAKHSLAGLVVSTEQGLYDIPSFMLQQANELDFPILTLSERALFTKITRAISKRIQNERHALMQKSMQIHNTLTQVVLMGDDLQLLAKALTTLVRCPVVIEDPSFRLLAYASWSEVNQANQERIQQDRTPRPLFIELGKRGILTQLRRSRQPIHIPPLPEQGLVSERIVAPIVAGQEFYGYVWIVVRDQTPDELDMIAIQHAATVAALILLKGKAIHEAESRLKSALLDELLTGDTDLQKTLAIKARHFDYDLTQGQQILLLQQRDCLPSASLHRWLDDLLSQWHMPGLTVKRAQHVVLLLPSESTRNGEALARRLWAQGQSDAYDLLIGVGRTYPGWDRLSESYQEAQEALEVGPLLMDEAVISFDALGVLHWLRHLPPDLREKNHFSQAIQVLAEHDAQRQSSLLETLETYLDPGQNGQETARRLYLHRNTLRQRLDKIQDICALELSDSLVSLNLHVAIKEYKLSLNS